MLKLKLEEVIQSRGIVNPYHYLVKNGFNYYTAGRLLRNERDSVSYVHLEKLCLLLDCSPSDLFVWQPAKDADVAPNHSLQKLRPKPDDLNLFQTLKKLPFDKLEQIKQFIKEMPEEQ